MCYYYLTKIVLKIRTVREQFVAVDDSVVTMDGAPFRGNNFDIVNLQVVGIDGSSNCSVRRDEHAAVVDKTFPP